MDEDNELENNSELTEAENTGTDNDSGTGEENNSDSENPGTDIPESGNNTDDENSESKKVYFSWNNTFNEETKDSKLASLPQIISNSLEQQKTAIVNAINSQKSAIENALGNIGISSGGSGGGGGSSEPVEISSTQIEEIVEEVLGRLRPTGHIYPDTNLYSKNIIPLPIFYSSSANPYTLNTRGIQRVNGRLPSDFIYELEHMDVSKFRNLGGFLSNVFVNSNDEELSLNLSNWDVSNVEDMTGLFQISASNTNGYLGSLDLSGWDTRNLRHMDSIFCANGGSNSTLKINNLNVAGWDVTNVQSLYYAFSRLNVPELDLSTWDLSYVENFDGCFSSYNPNSVLKKLLWGGSCNANLDLSKLSITPENAELFFQSLSNKMTNNAVTITMPTNAQGADISIATAKGYTIAGITQPS